MLKISKLADYGILIMLSFDEDHALQNTTLIAKRTALSITTVSKLSKLLSDYGLLQSHKGVNGGYERVKPIAAMTLADVIQAIDGPIAMTQCSHAQPSCTQLAHCEAKHNWQLINDLILSVFENITLENFAKPFKTHGLKNKVQLKPVITLNVEYDDRQ